MGPAPTDAAQARIQQALTRDDGPAAIVALQDAIRLDPGHGPWWRALAEQLHKLGRDAEARPAASRARALMPDDPDSALLVAVLDHQLGATAEAEAALRELLARQPLNAAARANLASLLERSNRHAEAEREAREGLKAAPHEPLLLHVVARCALLRRDLDTCALYLERERAAIAREPRHARSLLPQHAAYLEGELANARGRDAECFAAYARANAIAAGNAARLGFDGGRFHAELDAEAAAATPEIVAAWRPLPGPAPLPFQPAYLVGFPRSGTTLLEQILDAHPGAVGLEEVGCIEDALQAIPGGHPAGLGALDVAAREQARRYYAARVLERAPDAAGRTLIDKLPLRLVRAGGVQRLVPEARFILALRHPYDSVLSCFMQEFGMNDAMANFFTLEDAARLYDRAMTLWTRHAELLPLQVVTVRYEALVADLESEVRPVLAHLGLGWDARVQGFARHAVERGGIRTPSYSQVTQGLYTHARGRHRRHAERFSPAVRALLDPWVERWGYPSTKD